MKITKSVLQKMIKEVLDEVQKSIPISASNTAILATQQAAKKDARTASKLGREELEDLVKQTIVNTDVAKKKSKDLTKSLEPNEKTSLVKEREEKTMKINKIDLRKIVRETIKETIFKNPKLHEGVSSLQKDVLPGSGDMSKLAEETDKLLMDTAENAKALAEKLQEEMKVDMLGGEGKAGIAPRVGERNRMLLERVGVLRRLAANCVSMTELLRRNG